MPTTLVTRTSSPSSEFTGRTPGQVNRDTHLRDAPGHVRLELSGSWSKLRAMQSGRMQETTKRGRNRPESARRIDWTHLAEVIAVIIIPYLAPVIAGLAVACRPASPQPAPGEPVTVLPPLPTFDADSLEPTVRRQMNESRQRVESDPKDAEANGQLGMVFHT